MTIKVREGGYYRRRDGSVVGPAKARDDYAYPLSVGNVCYTSSGEYNINKPGHVSDLIAEVEVRDKLPFDLKDGGKYVLDNGDVVTLRAASFSPAVDKYVPLRAEQGKYMYVSCFGEVSNGDGAYVARIVVEYKEPPPTPAARLKDALAWLATNTKTADDLIRGVIAELEAKCSQH